MQTRFEGIHFLQSSLLYSLQFVQARQGMTVVYPENKEIQNIFFIKNQKLKL